MEPFKWLMFILLRGYISVRDLHSILTEKNLIFFFERIARGLLHKEAGLGYVKGKIEWKISFDEETYHSLPGNIKFFLSQGFYRSIANGQFKYLAFYKENHIGSMWFVRFFDVIEFMILLKE